MKLDSVAALLQSVALYLVAASLFLVPSGLALGLALLWLGFLLAFITQDEPAWLRDPVALLVMAFALYPGVRLLLDQTIGSPSAAYGHWDDVFDWLKLGGVLPFALALNAQQQRLRQLLLLVLIGLLLNILWRLEWSLLLTNPVEWVAWRDGFGFTAIAFGLFSGSALLAILLLRWPQTTGWTLLRWLAGLVLLQGFLLTQARSAWLAFLAALALGLALRWRASGTKIKLPSRPRTVLAALLVLGMIGFNSGLITQRLALEASSAQSLVNHSMAADDPTSISLRWRLQELGWSQWREHPWFGWGVSATYPMIVAYAQQRVLIDKGTVLTHLHNSYLEIVVQFGLFGLALFLLPVVGMFAGLLAARRKGLLSEDLFVVLACVLLLTLVWCLFNFRMLNQDWRGFWTLVAGSALSFGLAARQRLGAVRDASHDG